MTTKTHSNAHYHQLAGKNNTRLALALGITLLFVIVEAAAGWLSNSLALLSDAGHNLTDALALAISWVAIWLSARPASAKRTFGYHRAGILAALVNSTTLILIAIGIFIEAFQRLFAPANVLPNMMIVVGLIAVAVNAGTAWLVHRGSKADLNLRAAFVHLMGDVFSTIGAVVAGVLIIFTGWHWLDSLTSIAIGVLILWNAWIILRETLDILLESTPRDINIAELVADMKSIPGVQDVHDLHVWSITQSMRALSAHILTSDISIRSSTPIQSQIDEIMAHRYGILHTTLQFECDCCDKKGLYCNMVINNREREKILAH